MFSNIHNERLIKEREDRGWSRQALAKAADCGRTTIWKLETQQDYSVQEGTLKRIAGALGVRISVLLRPRVDGRRKKDVHTKRRTAA